MPEIDHELLRRYAGMIDDGHTLADAEKIGFVQDDNDRGLWAMAAKDPQRYLGGDPDSEIPNPVVDMSVIDDILSRIGKK